MFKSALNCILKTGQNIQRRYPIRKFSITSRVFGSVSYENGIYKSVYDDVSQQNVDLCSLMFPRWQKWSDKDALESLGTGQKLTYGELLDASLQWGGFLRDLKLRIEPEVVTYWNKTTLIPPRVSILSTNVIEYVPVMFGSLAAGFCFSGISSACKVDELVNNLKDSKPEVLVVHPDLEDVVDEALRKAKMNILVITIGTSSSGKANLKDILYRKDSSTMIEPKQMNPSDIALILYSSGTTGLPKGVTLPHKSITNNLEMFTNPKLYPYGPETEYQHETIMALLPYYHIYGIGTIVITNLFLGSKILVWDSFNPMTFGPIIKEHKMKFLHLVPTLLNFIVNSGVVQMEDLATVEGAFIASAPVHPSSALKFKEMLSKDIKFQECFGMTEICGATISPKDGARVGYCGQLLPSIKAKIVDLETNELVGPGKRGELIINTPAIMSHYLNNPKATYETVDEEGWLKTGDVAVATEDGYFSIVDRLKELIKVKEFQVSPAEIENILMGHSAVAEAGVVGIPDDRMGELPRAYVTLNEKVTEQELIDLVESKLSFYKQLTGGVVFLDDLPKSLAGKILRNELKKLALEDSK